MKLYVEDEGTAHNYFTEGELVVKTIDEEEQMETDKDMKYTSTQRHQKSRYEPTLQGKRYKDEAMLYNF